MKRLFVVMLVSVALLAACGEITPTPTVTPPLTDTPTPPTSGLPSPTPDQSPLITPVMAATVTVSETVTTVRAERADFEKPEQVKTMEEKGIMDNLLQTLLDFCMTAALPTIIGACALDIFVGIGAALRNQKFDLRKVGNFYQTQILALVVPYVGSLAVIALVPGLVDFLPAAVAPAGLFAGIMAKLAGSILANAQALSSGGAK